MYKQRKNLEYYSNIRNEYQSQLVNILKGPFYSGLKAIYLQVKQESLSKNDKNIMKNFQVALKTIPSWTTEIIDITSGKVIEKAECAYLPKLLEVVYKSNYKLLSSQTSKKKKGSGSKNLEIPALNVFIHKCYCEIAREIYINPFLMCDYDLTTWEIQSNLRETYRLIDISITNTIRKTLPFEKMIDLYLDDNESVQSELISSDLSISYSETESEREISDNEDEDEEPKEEPKEEIKEEEIKEEEIKEEEIKEEEVKEEKIKEVEDHENKSAEVEIEEHIDELPENDDAESLNLQNDHPNDIVGKDIMTVGDEKKEVTEEVTEEVKEEIQQIHDIVKDLDNEIEKEDVIVINDNDKEEEKAKFEKISDKPMSEMNVVPNEIQEKPIEQVEENLNDEIKRIKITPNKKTSRLLFFDDADSD